MTLANLRGIKESGKLFAPPAYIYVVSLAVAHRLRPVRGLRRATSPAMPVNEEALTRSRSTPTGGNPIFTGVTVLLLLRAFSSGAVALTGVEAISNGVPAFKKPESHERGHHPRWPWASSSASLFIGLSVLAHHLAADGQRERDAPTTVPLDRMGAAASAASASSSTTSCSSRPSPS